jgi:WD40 repeat protein
MDVCIKVWDLDPETSAVGRALLESQDLIGKGIKTGVWESRPVVREHFPILSTNRAHLACIDCVEFWGDLILSKSIDNSIILWEPVYPTEFALIENNTERGRLQYIKSFDFHSAEPWYIRFTTTRAVGYSCLSQHSGEGEYLAVGNTRGQLFIWDMGNVPAVDIDGGNIDVDDADADGISGDNEVVGENAHKSGSQANGACNGNGYATRYAGVRTPSNNGNMSELKQSASQAGASTPTKSIASRRRIVSLPKDKRETALRCPAFTSNGNLLAVCTDRGGVWFWNVTYKV